MSVIAVTGANGFIGKNLTVRFGEAGIDTRPVDHGLDDSGLAERLRGADAVIHLAGVNRSADPDDFATGNVGFTDRLVAALMVVGRRVPVIYASSIQAELENPYGTAKRAAEVLLEAYSSRTGSAVGIARLPNVFGKWCRPNYNSVVATFCHNIARGLPIEIRDAGAKLRLVYVDDVVDVLLEIVRSGSYPDGHLRVEPVYHTTVGDLAAQLARFRQSRETLSIDEVGTGYLRALNATYLSYLPPEDFAYSLVAHSDQRGTFVEMLRMARSGQVSFFTAHPGVTRGGHYHHSKTEKFLVIQGKARFGFRNIADDHTFSLEVAGGEPRVVETVPGWAHNITNIGDTTMVVMLWASELFDRERPDTIAAPVLPA
jgi:UDP-2-acetamido-2,6-beta-L-arabino-hexul-4-ose reductase